MQSRFINHQSFPSSEVSQRETLTSVENEVKLPAKLALNEPFEFHSSFTGSMDMQSNADIVAQYLEQHQNWFRRCAQPMKTEPLGENGYILTIGRFGSFGYEVEPKIAVVLLPPQSRVYDMHSIPVPDYVPPGYDVDYRACLTLEEVSEAGEIVTRVDWQLQLAVAIQFPKFIYKLPQSLIKSTGERILAKIVRQVSLRLTKKVQQDFHAYLASSEGS